MEENRKKKKVLILYNNLFHYRLPIFRILAESCDLTVAYSIGPDTKEDVNFKIIKLPIYKYDRLVIHKDNILKLCKGFDVVIGYGDIAWLKVSTLPFRKRRTFKVIFWTIGVSASYEKKYDAVSTWNSIRDFFYKRADAMILYSDYPIKNYVARGFDAKKLFVAPNTVEVLRQFSEHVEKKDSILFIGTLYMQKGILALLENYKLAHIANPGVLPLNIVGGGQEYETLKTWIEQNNLEGKVFLHGAVYDIKLKASYFKKALACISPVQAGLSVLESMGYGVPFITMHDALTGGERLNIEDGKNGVLMNDVGELKDILLDITMNSDKYIEMGVNAAAYYWKQRTPRDMANGILQAINYVSN